MVNKDSDLYRAHPDWILQTPQRHSCHGRNQYVLDFSRKEVVDCIYEMMYKILSKAKVSYRNTRTEMNVPNNRKTSLHIVAKDAETAAMYENSKKSFVNLAFAKEILVQTEQERNQ